MAQSRFTLGLCAAMLGTCLATQIFAADEPATKPAGPATTTAKRSTEIILAELRTTGSQLQKVLPSAESVSDAKFRKENAENILPTLKKLASLMDEFALNVQGTQRIRVIQSRFEILGLAVALGDKDSEKILTDAAASKDTDESIAAKSALTMGNWVKNSEDAAAQQKLLDEYTILAKANPDNETISQTLFMISRLGPANAELSTKAVAVVRTTMNTAAGNQLRMVGKPLTIEGRTTTGDKFSTASLKGKVVLIDFWATWCGPCKAELPRVKELYKNYHDKGLEIVGVDCDSSDDRVNTFTKTNEMTWTQLREESQNGSEQWHPLIKKFGINGIPTMFLIDKTGTLRYVDAREGTEDKVKKLLEEPEAKKENPKP